jgi:hypothetical protein
MGRLVEERDKEEKMKRLYFLKDFSFWMLLLSNLVTLFFAIKENWSYESIIMVYAAQSLSIGIVTLVRIMTLKNFKKRAVYTDSGERIKSVIPKKTIKIIYSILFILGYLLLNAFFFMAFSGIFEYGYESVPWTYILLPSGIFLINHLFSFFYNKERDKKKADIHKIMIFPYIRIIPIFLFTMLGGDIFGWFITRSEAGIILVFIILKTIADLIIHVIEHK